MSDVYVDKNAAGTGDGSSPTNAFVDVLSVTWGDGVRAWVRRTHTNAFTNSQFVGPNTFANAFSKWNWLIGWPNSGDPMYSERPAAGVSASWDSDNATTDATSTFGYNLPSLCGSNAINFGGGAFLQGRGVNICNFYLVNCGAVTGSWFSYLDNEELCFWNNIVPVFNNGLLNLLFNRNNASHYPIVGKLVLCSSNATTGALQGGFHVDDLVVHSLSRTKYLFSVRSAFTVGHVINQSNSIAYLIDGAWGAGGDSHPLTTYVRRASGVRPYSGANDPTVIGGTRLPFFVCDDYYGTGPLQLANPDGQCFTGVGTSFAAHSASPCMQMTVASLAANVQYKWTRRSFGQVAKQFSVTSGTQVAIRVPVYVDSTGVFSLTSGLGYATMYAAGCHPQHCVQSNVLPGTPAAWSGTLISGGSAYLLEFNFTPKETLANALFECHFPKLTQATSAQNFQAYMLMSEPYAQ